eukprot:6223439-Amphidinium_carterae.1
MSVVFQSVDDLPSIVMFQCVHLVVFVSGVETHGNPGVVYRRSDWSLVPPPGRNDPESRARANLQGLPLNFGKGVVCRSFSSYPAWCT